LTPGGAARAVELSLRNRREIGPECTVLERVSAVAAEDPGRLAVGDGDASLSYRALLERVERISRALRDLGHGTGDVVAAVGDRSAETIALFLALENIGAAYVPIDCEWPEQRVADVLHRAAAARLVDYCAAAGGPGRGAAAAKAAAETGVPVSEAPEPGGDPWTGGGDHTGRAAELRYCIFTSGTTGRPKGAAVEHRGMLNHLWAKVADLGLTSTDRLAFTAPLVFDISIWQMLAPLLPGGSIEVVRQDDLAFPRRLTGRLERSDVAVVELVPTVAGWIAAEAERRNGAILPHLRWLISTGEELHPGLAEQLLRALPHVRLLNAYGPTECSDDVTHHEVTAADLHRPRLPVGTPIANADLYLLTPDGSGRWRAAEPGETGELFVGGPVVGLGYVNDLENTAAAFYADPFDPASPTGRLYRTGDAARFDDGVVLYLGRLDRQVKIAGVRMELDEIEAVLRRHEAVDACAVIMTEANGRTALAAHYTAAHPITVSQLSGYLAAALPEAMVPRQLIRLDALPLTPNGKTDHRALRDALSRGADTDKETR
jgi:D-alanine--poly(phosphoribitol) ligase subunit 1